MSAAPTGSSEGGVPAPRTTHDSAAGSAINGQSGLAVASQPSMSSSYNAPGTPAANVDIRSSRDSASSAQRGGRARMRLTAQQRTMNAKQCVVTVTGDGTSVSTWSNWERTAQEPTISGTLTEHSSPGDVLEAQLDWIEKHRSGVLLPNVKCASVVPSPAPNPVPLCHSVLLLPFPRIGGL